MLKSVKTGYYHVKSRQEECLSAKAVVVIFLQNKFWWVNTPSLFCAVSFILSSEEQIQSLFYSKKIKFKKNRHELFFYNDFISNINMCYGILLLPNEKPLFVQCNRMHTAPDPVHKNNLLILFYYFIVHEFLTDKILLL